MNVTIVNTASGLTKLCTFIDFSARGAWAELRYPGGAGVWSFSLVHGGMEAKPREHALWRLGDEDFELLRMQAREKGIKFPRSKVRRVTPKKPLHTTAQRQIELFK